MEDNKNINPEDIKEEISETAAETAEEETTEKSDKKAKKSKKEKKPKKPKKIKNQALWHRGAYSVGIIAAVLAGIIVLNVLLGFLAKRVNLDFDMTVEKQNSVSKENIDYLRKLDKDVEITVCDSKEDYISGNGYMAYYAYQAYGLNSISDYLNQTVTILDKYPTYNKKININYVDTQSSEFTALSAKYANDNLTFGNIIVSSKNGSDEKYRVLDFDDIYNISQDQNSYAAMMGYSSSTISSNNAETAVTSAIAYVTSDKVKKAALITSHSSNDYTADYQTLLKANNYEIVTVSDAIISSIPNDCDTVIIAAPTTDFSAGELDLLSQFLENDGKLGKGLLYFADARAPRLTNLCDFLSQWGIAVDEGILFDTGSGSHIPDKPMTFMSVPGSDDKDLSKLGFALTGYNVPLEATDASESTVTVSSVLTTPAESVVSAPLGTADNWTGADSLEKKQYSTVIQAEKMEYDDDNNEIRSYVIAFSSAEFLQSLYNEYSNVANKEISLECTERSSGASDTGITFVSKTITNESFTPVESEASVAKIIFQYALPIISVVFGIYIFIRRKNAQ